MEHAALLDACEFLKGLCLVFLVDVALVWALADELVSVSHFFENLEEDFFFTCLL
jgi:hypothetical protein